MVRQKSVLQKYLPRINSGELNCLIGFWQVEPVLALLGLSLTLIGTNNNYMSFNYAANSQVHRESLYITSIQINHL